jgi:peptidylprolyl isomerase
VIKKRYFILVVCGLMGAALLIGGCSGAAKAKSGDKVKVDYTLTVDGKVFDTSIGKTPLEFTLGAGNVIPGFDKAVTGMKVGETKKVTIPPADGYGERNEQLVFLVQREQLPAGTDPQVGLQLQASNSDGSTSNYTITKIDDTGVTVDGNSPLAGKTLNFEVKLLVIE